MAGVFPSPNAKLISSSTNGTTLMSKSPHKYMIKNSEVLSSHMSHFTSDGAENWKVGTQNVNISTWSKTCHAGLSSTEPPTLKATIKSIKLVLISPRPMRPYNQSVKTAFVGPTICHSLLMLVPCQDLETEKYTIDTLTFFTVFSVTRFSSIQIKLYFDQILNLSLLAIYCYLFFKIEALCDKWEEEYYIYKNIF